VLGLFGLELLGLGLLGLGLSGLGFLGLGLFGLGGRHLTFCARGLMFLILWFFFRKCFGRLWPLLKYIGFLTEAFVECLVGFGEVKWSKSFISSFLTLTLTERVVLAEVDSLILAERVVLGLVGALDSFSTLTFLDSLMEAMFPTFLIDCLTGINSDGVGSLFGKDL